jgi:hypothetical protein
MRDINTLQMIERQLRVTPGTAINIYDEIEKQKALAREKAIRETLIALRKHNYDVSYTPQEIEAILQERDWF